MPAECDLETSTNRRHRPGPIAIVEPYNKIECFDSEQTPAKTFPGSKPLYVSPSAVNNVVQE
jgi:hypothetical protein